MALAFELDPDRESIPPYSEGTLFHYAKDRKWSAAVEEKFRAFAESNQKRYTFNPMKSGQRAFLHSLAEDYGFQSVSQDPEPYRSVILFKGSNNGTAPKKTIAEYIASKPSAVPTSTPVSIQQLKKPQRQPYNAIILQNIRIGLLNAEIERELEPVLKDTQLRFNLQWSGGDDVLLVPKASSFGNDQIDVELADALIPQLKRLIAKNGLADKAELCLVGKDGQIVNRESQPKWSLVVGKSSPAAGTKPPAQANVGSKSRFDLEHGKAELARKSAESLKKKEKKKGKEVDVVDDWETAADNEAEAAGGGLASSVSMEANMGDEVEGQV
jgi:transcriptional repressor NF-X1